MSRTCSRCRRCAHSRAGSTLGAAGNTHKTYTCDSGFSACGPWIDTDRERARPDSHSHAPWSLLVIAEGGRPIRTYGRRKLVLSRSFPFVPKMPSWRTRPLAHPFAWKDVGYSAEPHAKRTLVRKGGTTVLESAGKSDSRGVCYRMSRSLDIRSQGASCPRACLCMAGRGSAATRTAGSTLASTRRSSSQQASSAYRSTTDCRQRCVNAATASSPTLPTG